MNDRACPAPPLSFPYPCYVADGTDRIPWLYRRCTRCSDGMEDETCVRGLFSLYFRLQDEDGTTLEVSVGDERVSLIFCALGLRD